MKIAFIDIDGVICINGKTFDKKSIDLLNELVEKTGSKIVISSSQRYLYSMGDLLKKFKESGFNGEIIDKTPMWKDYKHLLNADNKTLSQLLSLQYERGEEIKLWMNWNKDKNIESFVIIDDEVDDIYPVFPYNFVKTDSTKGFVVRELLDESISILNRGDRKDGRI